MKICQPYLDQRGPSEGMVPPSPFGHGVPSSSPGGLSHADPLGLVVEGHGLPALCPDAWWALNFPWVNTPLPHCANLQHQLPVGEGKALVNPAVDSGRQRIFTPERDRTQATPPSSG